MMECGQVQFVSIVQESIAWTLLHSIWQGTVLVFIILLLEKLLKFKNKEVIHLISKLALLSFLFCVFITFGLMLDHPNQKINWHILSLPGIPEYQVILKWVNGLWIVGLLITSVKYVFSLNYLSNIRRQVDFEFPQEWIQTFSRIKEAYSLNANVLLAQSEHVSSAFVTGVIKPMIIIPTSWINQLNVDEAECIIAHELAHILQFDHWMNLVCNIAEIIFFFNPAVYFINHRIRFQRELCADARAIQLIKRSLEYASLILKLESKSSVKNPFVLIGFSAIRNQLSHRIKQILNIHETNTYTHSINYSYVIIFCIGLITLFNIHPTQNITTDHLVSNDLQKHTGIITSIERHTLKINGKTSLVSIRKTNLDRLQSISNFKEDHNNQQTTIHQLSTEEIKTTNDQLDQVNTMQTGELSLNYTYNYDTMFIVDSRNTNDWQTMSVQQYIDSIGVGLWNEKFHNANRYKQLKHILFLQKQEYYYKVILSQNIPFGSTKSSTPKLHIIEDAQIN